MLGSERQQWSDHAHAGAGGTAVHASAGKRAPEEKPVRKEMKKQLSATCSNKGVDLGNREETRAACRSNINRFRSLLPQDKRRRPEPFPKSRRRPQDDAGFLIYKLISEKFAHQYRTPYNTKDLLLISA